MAFARAIVVFAVLSLTFCSHLDIAESSSAHDTTATISFLEGGVVAEIEVCSGSYCGDFNGKKRVVETRIEDNVSDFPARVFLRRIQDYWILGFFSTRTDSRQILLPERSHSGLEVEQSNYTETECDDSIPQINKCGSISPYTRQNADLGTAMEEGYERRISHQTRNAYPSDSYEGEQTRIGITNGPQGEAMAVLNLMAVGASFMVIIASSLSILLYYVEKYNRRRSVVPESDEDPNGCDVNVDPGLSTVELRALNDRWGEIPYGTGFPSKFRVSTCSLTSSQAVEHDDTVTDDYVIDDEEDLPPAECCICLTEISVGDRCRVLPQCSHLFHTSCIGTWLKCSVRCPMCNGSLRDILNAEMWCGREQSRAFSHTAYAPPSLVCPPSSPMAVRGSRTQRTLSNSNFQSRGSGASLSDLSAVSSPQPVFLSKPLRSFSRVGIAGLEGEHLPSIYDSLVTNPYNSDSRSKAEAS